MVHIISPFFGVENPRCHQRLSTHVPETCWGNTASGRERDQRYQPNTPAVLLPRGWEPGGIRELWMLPMSSVHVYYRTRLYSQDGQAMRACTS